MKHQVVIDRDACIGCGQCMLDCVGADIELVSGKAYARGMSCIGCGHCEAVCPKQAVTLTGFDEETEAFDEQVRLDPEQLMAAIKTRRTVRQFTQEPVPRAVIKQILEAGRLAPTAQNGQQTVFALLQDSLEECEAAAVKLFRTPVDAVKKLVPALESMKIDDHFFFKKAPVVIVIYGGDKVSASLAAQNMAFMAEANGLGVLFSGFFTVAANIHPKIRKIIGVKGGKKAVTTLVIGYPAVKYHRTARREKLKLLMR